MAMHPSYANPLLSAPIEVHAFGWRSDTYTLQKQGWMFSVQYEPHHMCFNLALKHRSNHMCGLSFGNRIDDYTMEHMQSAHQHREFAGRFPPIAMSVWGNSIHLQGDRWRGQARYDAVDMRPVDRMVWMEHEVHQSAIQGFQNKNHMPFEIFAIFRPVTDEVTETKEVLIEERSIGELMGIIKERYASSDQEYYEQQVDEDKNVIISDQHEVKRHLQLVSLSR